MAYKNYFSRLAAETGMPSPKQEEVEAMVAIHHNIVKDFKVVTDPDFNRWRRQVLAAGYNVATVTENQARVLVGKRFQEQSYYHSEAEGTKATGV